MSQVQRINQDGSLLIQAGKLSLRVQPHEVERAEPKTTRKRPQSSAALPLQTSQDAQPGEKRHCAQLPCLCMSCGTSSWIRRDLNCIGLPDVICMLSSTSLSRMHGCKFTFQMQACFLTLGKEHCWGPMGLLWPD